MDIQKLIEAIGDSKFELTLKISSDGGELGIVGDDAQNLKVQSGNNKLLSRVAAAEYLDMSPKSFDKFKNEHNLPFYPKDAGPNQRKKYRISDLDDAIEKYGNDP